MPAADSVPDVVIVGGGVIGLMMADSLSLRGRHCDGAGSKPAGTGSIVGRSRKCRPRVLEHARGAAVTLPAYSHQRWRSFSQALRELTGMDNSYLESGGLELGFDGEGDRIATEGP